MAEIVEVRVFAWREGDVSEAYVEVRGCDDPDRVAAFCRAVSDALGAKLPETPFPEEEVRCTMKAVKSVHPRPSRIEDPKYDPPHQIGY